MPSDTRPKPRRGLSRWTASTAVGLGLALAGPAVAESPVTGHSSDHAAAPAISMIGDVPWDAEASHELTKALHRMHEVWNTGDVASLKELMIGDDVLVSFELDPDSHEPVRLTSKAEVQAFVEDTARSIAESGMVTQLEMPSLNCRATANFGVCTEECTVNFLSQETREIVATDKLWSTAVAVKLDGGWRWIQWHMSSAAVPQSIAARSQ